MRLPRALTSLDDRLLGDRLRRRPADGIRADLAELSDRSAGYFRSAEGREGVAAFREKRPAAWVPAPR